MAILESRPNIRPNVACGSLRLGAHAYDRQMFMAVAGGIAAGDDFVSVPSLTLGTHFQAIIGLTNPDNLSIQTHVSGDHFMLGLWTGSAESVAIKMSFFMGFLSFSLCIISVAIPFFLLRKSSSTLGTVLGYILGFAVTFAGLVASVVYLELIEHVPPPISSGGPFRNFPVALIGPAVGIWAAKRARGQQPK